MKLKLTSGISRCSINSRVIPFLSGAFLYGGSFNAPSSALPAPGVENTSASASAIIKLLFNIFTLPPGSCRLRITWIQRRKPRRNEEHEENQKRAAPNHSSSSSFLRGLYQHLLLRFSNGKSQISNEKLKMTTSLFPIPLSLLPTAHCFLSFFRLFRRERRHRALLVGEILLRDALQISFGDFGVIIGGCEELAI